MKFVKHFLLALVIFSSHVLIAQKRVNVAQDGSGQYKTVQAALDAVPVNNKKPIVIYVKSGIYKEKLHLDATKNNVTIIGADKFNTLLTYDDHTGKIAPNGEAINTRTSWSFIIKADNFKAENISFQNDAGFTAGQAVAVEVQGDKAFFKNCRFLGFQDVLFTNSDKSRQYYKNCYIEGTTDFIFGSATALFESCHIHSKKNSHVTAASTLKERPYGYVFYDCTLTADSSLHSVSLGRPWQPYASVTYLHCYIGQHIITGGWDNWKNPANEKTARYAEYKNYGPGGNTSNRVPWSQQLTDEEAKNYKWKNIFGDWQLEECKM